MQQQKLPYITDETLYLEVKKVLEIASNAVEAAEISLYDNVIDPFSAVFDASRQGIGLTEWLEQEKARQIQKTMQNAVGDFHQAILGNVAGWEDLGVGNVIDIKNDSRRLIAEVKNKHNTTKGNDRKNRYDELKRSLDATYIGYTGYFVEIIPKTKRPYDKPFVPSDNETHARRPTNEHIRVTDGRSFYTLVTGNPNSLSLLYATLPLVIAEIVSVDPAAITSDPKYRELFLRAYPDIR